MKLPCVKNIKSQEVFWTAPWDFQPKVPLESLLDKSARQDNYETIDHCFYSGFVGVDPHTRISDANPADSCLAVVYDIDTPITQEAVSAAIGCSPLGFRPAYVEHTLSTKWRFIYTFEKPVSFGVEKTKDLWREFLSRFLDHTKVMNVLPPNAIDLPAFKRTGQVYFNHCNFFRINDGAPIKFELLKQIIRDSFNAVAKYSKVSSGTISDFARAYEKLSQRWPRFSKEWTPENFKLGGQGTSFWVEGSVSPMSAIVKSEGMLTFSEHARRIFYPWTTLLGADSVERDHRTRDDKIMGSFFFCDSEQKYYKFLDPEFVRRGSQNWLLSLNKEDVKTELTLLGVNPVKDKDAGPCSLSEAEMKLLQIRNQNRVNGVAPFMFYEERVVDEAGSTWLNSYIGTSPLSPSAEVSEWGPNGKFPNLSRILETRFSKGKNSPDLYALLSYLRILYQGTLERRRQVKQALVMVGEVQTGKTFLNTGLFKKLLGGAGDGSSYLTGESRFDGKLFNNPLITVDDAAMSVSSNANRIFTERAKALVSKSTIRTEEKFKNAGAGRWFGGLTISANVDSGSLFLALPDLTSSISDKLVIVYLDGAPMKESEPELVRVLEEETRYFARWLLDVFEIPVTLKSDGRYQMKAYKNPEILDDFETQSDEFAFVRTLVRCLKTWAVDEGNQNKRFYRGDQTEIHQLISAYGVATSREYNQRRVAHLLRQLHKASVVENPWLTKDRGERRWVIDLSLLPKV